MASRRIPEDLLVEILKRLPVKSLMRFKATSKRWCSLIKSSNFIKSHLASAPDRVLILTQARNRRFFLFPDVDDDDDDDDGSRAVNIYTRGLESVNLNPDGVEPVIDFNQLGGYTSGFVSCDGIVCSFGGYMFGASSPIIWITLWNPATRKSKSLPTSSYSASIKKVGAQWNVGFGFDRKTDDYKVVALISLRGEGELLPFMNYAEVYSLKSNSWRVIDEAVAPIFISITPPIYTQGVCYWIAYLDEACVLASFDMEEEGFRVIPAPPSKAPPYSVTLASSNESILVMYYNSYSPIEVWAMKYLFPLGGDCWTLEYILEPHSGVPPFLNFKPLGLWKNCLLFIKYGDNLKKICLYNPGSREIRNLEFRGRILDPRACGYKETLVSLA